MTGLAALLTLTACGTPAATVGHQADPPAPSPSSARTSASPPSLAVGYPRDGGGRFTTAPGDSPVYGRAGTLLRYRVDVETDIVHLDVTAFADAVTGTLADPRSWTAGGQWRFQRVGADQPADFTVYLVTPGTRDSMCHDVPDGYTSCRYEDSVVLNVSRWVHGAPTFTDLAQYRQYMVNHEVGHRLGNGHELCPGPGKPAPTMQQQTLGLHGCVPNAWPYLDGSRYAGVSGAYDDPVPTDPSSYYEAPTPR
jgi:uncharacterized protein DUF3152